MGPMGVVTVYRVRYIFRVATNAQRKKKKRRKNKKNGGAVPDDRSREQKNFIWTARKALRLFSENYSIIFRTALGNVWGIRSWSYREEKGGKGVFRVCT